MDLTVVRLNGVSESEKCMSGCGYVRLNITKVCHGGLGLTKFKTFQINVLSYEG